MFTTMSITGTMSTTTSMSTNNTMLSCTTTMSPNTTMSTTITTPTMLTANLVKFNTIKQKINILLGGRNLPSRIAFYMKSVVWLL